MVKLKGFCYKQADKMDNLHKVDNFTLSNFLPSLILLYSGNCSKLQGIVKVD
jgi:hypothetical protein